MVLEGNERQVSQKNMSRCLWYFIRIARIQKFFQKKENLSGRMDVSALKIFHVFA